MEGPATVRLTTKLGATTRSPHESSEEGSGASTLKKGGGPIRDPAP